MKAAMTPLQRPPDARLLVVHPDGELHNAARTELPRFLSPGDLLVANDAATIPASLGGHRELHQRFVRPVRKQQTHARVVEKNGIVRGETQRGLEHDQCRGEPPAPHQQLGEL